MTLFLLLIPIDVSVHKVCKRIHAVDVLGNDGRFFRRFRNWLIFLWNYLLGGFLRSGGRVQGYRDAQQNTGSEQAYGFSMDGEYARGHEHESRYGVYPFDVCVVGTGPYVKNEELT